MGQKKKLGGGGEKVKRKKVNRKRIMLNQPHDGMNREWTREKLTGIHPERADSRCLEDP